MKTQLTWRFLSLVALIAAPLASVPTLGWAGPCCQDMTNPRCLTGGLPRCQRLNELDCIICLGLWSNVRSCDNDPGRPQCKVKQGSSEGCSTLATTEPVTDLPAVRTLTVLTSTCEIVPPSRCGDIEFPPLVSGFTGNSGTVDVVLKPTYDQNLVNVTIKDISNLSFKHFLLGKVKITDLGMQIIEQELSLALDTASISGSLKFLTKTNVADVTEDAEVSGTFDLSQGQLKFSITAELSCPTVPMTSRPKPSRSSDPLK